MKNLLFGLVAIVLFSFNANAQNIEESTVIITQSRVAIKSGDANKSARSFLLLNFNKDNKLSKEYCVDEHIYTDDGEKNDLKAGDGIYTSIDLFENLKEEKPNYLMKSEAFEFNDELEQQISTNKWVVKIGCKVRHVRTGYTTILGLDCAHVLGGCIEFYDCEISWHYEW